MLIYHMYGIFSSGFNLVVEKFYNDHQISYIIYTRMSFIPYNTLKTVNLKYYQ